MITSPGSGLGSKAPHGVNTAVLPGTANAGRGVVTNESPYTSLPTVILNGRPEFWEINGEKRKPSGAVQLPPINVWKRESKAARPYSLLRSYWFAGNVVAPSVLLLALPTVK